MNAPDYNWRQQAGAKRLREDIIQAVEDLTAELGYPPLRREIAERLEIHEDVARRIVKKLITDGRLAEGDGPRTLHIPL